MVLSYSNKHQVFVYGTLKRDFHNYAAVLADSCAEYLGDATTEESFVLFADVYGIPYLARARNPEEDYPVPIKGELFAVDDALLEKLDELEGVPERYQRADIQVKTSSTTKDREAKSQVVYAYILQALPDPEYRRLLLGDEYTLEFHRQNYTPPGPQRDPSKKMKWGGYV